MVDIEEMVALQEVDIRLDVLKRRIGGLNDQLQEPDAHRALADEIAAQQARLDEVGKARQEIEAQAAVLRAKIETEDGKLYGGQTTDAKELRNLQEEVFALRRGLKAQDEELLARLGEEEIEQQALDYLQALSAGSRAAWDERRAQLQSQHDEVSAEAEVIIVDLNEHRSQIAESDLAVYDAHRQRRRVVVAAAVGGVCGSCRLTLPTTILNRARRGLVAVNCPACDCIVYIR